MVIFLVILCSGIFTSIYLVLIFTQIQVVFVISLRVILLSFVFPRFRKSLWLAVNNISGLIELLLDSFFGWLSFNNIRTRCSSIRVIISSAINIPGFFFSIILSSENLTLILPLYSILYF